MTIPFSRTPTGIVGKWHFYSEPTIWVEGPTDIFFFYPFVVTLGCRIEAFHGIDNAIALIEGLRKHNFPYIVVLDGDYTILESRRSPHKRVIRLRRYSVENYLWEKEPFNRACLRHAQCGEQRDECYAEFDRITHHIHASLHEVVVLDVAARRSDPPLKVLPDRIDPLLVKRDQPDIDFEKVNQIVADIAPKLNEQIVSDARIAVAGYLKERRVADLLRGHCLFGLIRLAFTKLTSAIRGTKVIVNDDSLAQLLSDAVWYQSTSKDHRHLRSSLRRHVRECIPKFSPKRV